MSFIKVNEIDDTLDITLRHHFNYLTVQIIKRQIHARIKHLIIHHEHCPILDSEAVIFLYKWQRSGKQLTLSDPPSILFDILDILELRDSWNVTIKKDESHVK